MEKNKKRAERRAQRARMLHKVAKQIDYKYSNPSSWWNGFEVWKDQYVRKHADTRKPCSCDVCGNPRKYWHKDTLQEKKFSQREKFCDEC